MSLRILVVLFWIFTLLQPASAQTWRRRNQSLPKTPAPGSDKTTAGASTSDQKSEPASELTGQDNSAEVVSRLQEAPRTETHGWVWVSRTIDLAQQLGEDNLMTLDGEPLLEKRKPSVTLGLVIDDEGHVVTRLVGA